MGQWKLPIQMFVFNHVLKQHWVKQQIRIKWGVAREWHRGGRIQQGQCQTTDFLTAFSVISCTLPNKFASQKISTFSFFQFFHPWKFVFNCFVLNALSSKVKRLRTQTLGTKSVLETSKRCQDIFFFFFFHSDFSCFWYKGKQWIGDVPSEPLSTECGLNACIPCEGAGQFLSAFHLNQ